MIPTQSRLFRSALPDRSGESHHRVGFQASGAGRRDPCPAVMMTGALPGHARATRTSSHRDLRSELRTTRLRLNDVDERRCVSPAQRCGLDTEFLHRPLVERRPIEAGFAGYGL